MKDQEQMSQEQIKEKERVLMEEMERQMSFLELREKYTRLQAAISENVFKDYFHRRKLSEASSPPEKGGTDGKGAN